MCPIPAVFISNELIFIDRTYKLPGSERIFTVRRTAKALNLLSGEQLRKVFEFEYRYAVQTSLVNNTALCLFEIKMGCGLTADETENALEEMLQLSLIKVYESNEGEFRYVFGLVMDFMYWRSMRLPDLRYKINAWS